MLEPIYLLYDERMLEHRPVNWVEPTIYPRTNEERDEDYEVENPERLRVLYDRLCQVEERIINDEVKKGELQIPSSSSSHTIFEPLACPMATKEQVLLVHSEAQYVHLEQLQEYSDSELLDMSERQRDEVYYCRETFQAALLAAGGLIASVDAVCCPSSSPPPSSSATSSYNYNTVTTNHKKRALALVRPPGHHACQEREMGFCFMDNVVIAAKYALSQQLATRVVILDWDIHDGNGTAEATIRDENIFRIDIHRAQFYPYTGGMSEVGLGNARGLNLNLAWSQGGIGNSEYSAAFYELILPLMAEYNPDLVLISCGMDAAKGDLLGGCEVTPDFFHAMTRATLEVVGPDTPVVCALEGGYSMHVIPDCMEAVALAMVNCPYKFHSSLQIGSFIGGASVETRRNPWPSDNKLERSRKALSKYYIRDGCYRLIPKAIHDINTCIRIFHNLPRWKGIPLRRLPIPFNPNTTNNHNKHVGSKRKKFETTAPKSPLEEDLIVPLVQRPRIYLWYGTERHHVKVW